MGNWFSSSDEKPVHYAPDHPKILCGRHPPDVLCSLCVPKVNWTPSNPVATQEEKSTPPNPVAALEAKSTPPNPAAPLESKSTPPNPAPTPKAKPTPLNLAAAPEAKPTPSKTAASPEAKPTPPKPAAATKAKSTPSKPVGTPKAKSTPSNHAAATKAKSTPSNPATSGAQLMKQLPHNYKAIVKDSDSLINEPSPRELLEELQKGIFLDEMKKKYWVDKNSNNCFTVYARDLSIIWGGDSRYWRWNTVEDGGDPIDVAELLDVRRLEVYGKLDTAYLSPKTLYEVVFVVKLNAKEYGWDEPVEFTLETPAGDKHTRNVDLTQKQRGKWVEIPAGEFRASPEQYGNMIFSLRQLGGQWKKGLVIKGAEIRPKTKK